MKQNQRVYGATDIAPESFSEIPKSEPELCAWAQQSAVRSNSSQAGRIGLVVFWIVIIVLLMARFFIFDASTLRSTISSAPAFDKK